jgi:cell division protein FtsZ
MGEVGMAMMGSAMAGGADRARIAAQQAVRSPLLEDVNLLGARGVLVNITASAGLKMKEYHEVMNTIKSFTADDAMVIVGTVIDEAMKDELRVTMIATGLGGVTARNRQPRLEVVEHVVERTGTDNVGMSIETVDYDSLDKTPAVTRHPAGWTRRRPRAPPRPPETPHGGTGSCTLR